ncbi:hypothetical protein ABPG72_009672 [Tetrahymena utriculariae]
MAYKPKVLKSLKSPGFFMNTRKGTLYQLTNHNSEPLNLNHLIVSQSDFLHCEKLFEVLKEQNKSFKSFIGFSKEEEPKKCIYLSPIDYYKPQQTMEATAKADTVKLYTTRGGYFEVSDDQYYKISKMINPDIIVSLTEIPTGKGKKSHKRSVEKTIGFLDKAISIFRPKSNGNSDQNENHLDKSTLIFGSIEGGQFDEQRKECVQKTLERDIDGVVLHGTESAETIEEKARQIALTMECLGEHKDSLYTVYSSKGTIQDILLGVSNGIDYFEVDYPNQLAHAHQALNLDFDNKNYVDTQSLFSEDILNELKTKQPKTFNMTEYDKHKESLIGFTDGCQCYACQNHTQAYVAHLIKCKELTGTILITIHNVHQYNILFQQLQEAAENQKLSNYISWFIKTNLI